MRTLVPGFLLWWSNQAGERFGDELHSTAIDAYRKLRREVIASGIERDAASCLAIVTGELGLTVSDDDIAQGLEAMMRPALEMVEPQPGAVELVTQLHAAGVPVAIVSSAVYHPFLEWTVEKFGLNDTFSVILSSAACGHYKSRPVIYQIAAETLAREPAECVHIGDSLEFDVQTASQAGMNTIWINWDHEHANGARPDLTVTTLHGLAPRLLHRFGSVR